MRWEKRWPKLRALILRHNPDIIGLQEVDLGGFPAGWEQAPCHASEIAEDLRRHGYEGVFARKAGRACDGCALFWRCTRLQPCGPHAVLPLGVSVHVALVQPLCLKNGCTLLAVVTHLKAGLDIGAENVRRAQAEALLGQLVHRPEPVVMLADLNAHCRDFTTVEGAPVPPWTYGLVTAGGYRSAYQDVDGEEPEYTCWGGWSDRDVRGVFDYILLRDGARCPVRALGALKSPPADQVLASPTRLPSATHPTDHVEMVADIALTALPCPRQHKRSHHRYYA